MSATLAPGEITTCRDCPKRIASKRTAARLGLYRHDSGGRCGACALRHRRANALSDPERPRLGYEIPHGTYAGYRRCRHRAEGACAECRQANAEYQERPTRGRRRVRQIGLPTDAVEALWLAARRKGQADRRPSAGITAVLLALHQGAGYGSEIARRASQNQANTTAVWLPKLERLGFVAFGETVPGVGGGVRKHGHGGARPAQYWRLTARGRELVEALLGEIEDEGEAW